MEMEQIMSRLLAEIKAEVRTSQAKTDADKKVDREDMEETMESQRSCLVSRMEADRKSDWEETRVGKVQMDSLVFQPGKDGPNLNEIREEI
jgi:hypothetical protein